MRSWRLPLLPRSFCPLATAVLLAVAGPAAAQPAGAPAPSAAAPAGAVLPSHDASPPENPTSEWLIAGGQLLAGGAINGLAVIAARAIPDGWALLPLLSAPIALGLSTCKIGGVSDHYRSSCGWTAAGAWVGTAIAGALAYGIALGYNKGHDYAPDPEDDAPRDRQIATVWILIPPLLATSVWHLFRQPLRQQSLALPAGPHPRLRSLSAASAERRRLPPLGGSRPILFPIFNGTF